MCWCEACFSQDWLRDQWSRIYWGPASLSVMCAGQLPEWFWVHSQSFSALLCFKGNYTSLAPLAFAFLICLANVCQKMEGWEGGGTTVFLPLSLSVSCGVSCSNCISSRVLITSKNPLLQWFHLPQGSLHWLQLLLGGSRFFGYQLPPFVPSVLVVIIAFCGCLPIS